MGGDRKGRITRWNLNLNFTIFEFLGGDNLALEVKSLTAPLRNRKSFMGY